MSESALAHAYRLLHVHTLTHTRMRTPAPTFFGPHPAVTPRVSLREDTAQPVATTIAVIGYPLRSPVIPAAAVSPRRRALPHLSRPLSLQHLQRRCPHRRPRRLQVDASRTHTHPSAPCRPVQTRETRFVNESSVAGPRCTTSASVGSPAGTVSVPAWCPLSMAVAAHQRARRLAPCVPLRWLCHSPRRLLDRRSRDATFLHAPSLMTRRAKAQEALNDCEGRHSRVTQRWPYNLRSSRAYAPARPRARCMNTIRDGRTVLGHPPLTAPRSQDSPTPRQQGARLPHGPVCAVVRARLLARGGAVA